MCAITEPEAPQPLRSMAAATAQLLAADGRFAMRTVDVGGVRTRTWVEGPPTLRAIAEASAGRGDSPALVYHDERISHAGFHRAVAALARRLVGDFGVAPGDRVALAMRNYPEWVIGFFAATAVGAVAVPLNSWWTARELEFGLRDSEACVVLADGERLTRLADVLPGLAVPVIATRTGTAALPEGVWAWTFPEPGSDPGPLPAAAPEPDDPAAIFYTAGTTGLPKGAVASHRNMLSNITSAAYAQMRAFVRLGLDPADVAAFIDALPPPAVLTVLPLFHATGAQTVMLPTLDAGGTLVLMRRWDPTQALGLIERERIHRVTGVPAMFADLLAAPGFADHDLSSLLSVSSGGAPAAPALVSRVRGTLHDLTVAQGYGLTECSAIATVNAGADLAHRPGSVGAPVAVVDVKVVDPLGAELPAGEVGEVWIRGPGVVHGYWRRPEETAAAFTDGWLHTGDLGRLDDEGFLSIVDRAKDMIIRGGENVYCVEVEAAVHEHPAVVEVAVLGVPHEVLGEEVGAVVRIAPGGRLDGAGLRAFLEPRIAAFKIPAHVRIGTAELPRNPAGKLLKKRLREQHGWGA
ncbi:acyl-CoA synthetase (AMP-forming)/AMP-acid ligase II [Murinocardiopsis flavida]|uniref:Acyl-CoA synthetase (AMP-forming)/AMP-acid ligase II n=1 Tax=Murinocardiopsis flavida TaxID=645275 RepID=A0A2P8DS31_9ACTN|nr:AMP-binding protein [Murinocardiopsis flavida]PSL00034.1 acyl-CoA synthetase (AMP-forming)/AMP-acid ligase II [Murinocardiopsis flavida]